MKSAAIGVDPSPDASSFTVTPLLVHLLTWHSMLMMLIGKHVEIRVCVCARSSQWPFCGDGVDVWSVQSRLTSEIDSRVHQPTMVNMNLQSLKRKAHSPQPRNTTVNRVSAVIFRKQTINKWRWLLKYTSCFAANALWLADNLHWLDTRTQIHRHGLRAAQTEKWSETGHRAGREIVMFLFNSIRLLLLAGGAFAVVCFANG